MRNAFECRDARVRRITHQNIIAAGRYANLAAEAFAD
jgi:hypothetical protein